MSFVFLASVISQLFSSPLDGLTQTDVGAVAAGARRMRRRFSKRVANAQQGRFQREVDARHGVAEIVQRPWPAPGATESPFWRMFVGGIATDGPCFTRKPHDF
jgi:hypothetical protein